MIDSLIGVHIVDVFVATWETGIFNAADFIYKLSDERYVRIPDFYVSVTHVESCTLECGYQPVSHTWKKQHASKLIGRSIVDIFVPRDPECRAADTAAIQLDSGCYLMQESGAPQGILPETYLVDVIDLLQKCLDYMAVIIRQSSISDIVLMDKLFEVNDASLSRRTPCWPVPRANISKRTVEYFDPPFC